MGSGQTALAAIQSGRHFIGYEIDANYIELANQRIQDYRVNLQLEELDQ
jgi:site-specific DNA-methyltransferase (adenine-specific)